MIYDIGISDLYQNTDDWDLYHDEMSDIKILPNGDSHEYEYFINNQHYPGTHWYHAHSHGTTSNHVQMGLFGALIVEQNETLPGYSLQDYESNILMFSWLYLIDSECDCDDGSHQDHVYTSCNNAPKGCFFIYSLCYEYCEYDSTQRQSSTYNDYNNFIDKQINDENREQFFLVNGQLEPEININKDKYRLLKFINANSHYYFQYALPTTNCEWVLLGYDGVWFTSDTNQVPNRNLNDSPFNGFFILPPGGRYVCKCFSRLF